MSLVLTTFSWFGLGASARADREDFELVTLLQGGVPKAITDFALTQDYKSEVLGPDHAVDGSFGKAVEQPLWFLLHLTKRESGVEGLWLLCLGPRMVRR